MADLKAELEKLQQEYDALQKKYAELEQKADEVIKKQAAEISALVDEKASLTKELEATVKTNGQLAAKIEKLNARQPKAPESPKSFKDATFTDDSGIEYGFKLPHVHLPEVGKINFEAVLLDKELQSKLITRKSGMIFPVKGQWS